MSYLLIDLEGQTLSSEEKELIQHPMVAGLIFFQRNFSSFSQLSDLVSEIRELTSDRDFLLSVDQEGGRVQRFHNEFTSLPALGDVSALQIPEAECHALTQDLGWLMASEIRAAGIDISFAPVLDVDVGVSEVIGRRSFGSDPATVIPFAEAYINGMAEAGMKATAKHFPGHGAIRADSHLESPVDHRDYKTLETTEMSVFTSMINKGLAAVMPAHVIYPEVDHRPASFSPVWLKDILRKQLGFNGCIFSDDLTMAAATAMGSPAHRAEQALAAGCDIILCCNDRGAAKDIMENASFDDNPDALQRLKSMCSESTLKPVETGLEAIQSTPRYNRIVETLKQAQ